MAALATPQSLDRAGMLMHMNETPPAEPLEFTPANMKTRREQMRLSQTALGQMLTPPAGQRTIVHWENGDYKIKSPRKEQLAEILGLTLPGMTPKTEASANIAAVRAEVAVEQAVSLLVAAISEIRSLR